MFVLLVVLITPTILGLMLLGTEYLDHRSERLMARLEARADSTTQRMTR